MKNMRNETLEETVFDLKQKFKFPQEFILGRFGIGTFEFHVKLPTKRMNGSISYNQFTIN